MGNYESKDVKKRKKYAARKHTDEQTNEHVVHECTRAHIHTHAYTQKYIHSERKKRQKFKGEAIKLSRWNFSIAR